MKTINLFIACSTTSDILNDQKEAVVTLCKKLSVEYAEKGERLTINPVAYDDLERRMQVFNNYIRGKADIVVFLLDKTLGPFLEEELNLAVDRYRMYHRPELLVYLSDRIDDDARKKTEEILEEGGWLYDIPKDKDSLVADVEKRIKGYVTSYENIRKEQKRIKIRRWWWVYLLATIAIFFSVFFPLYQKQKQALERAESKRLLITGGGSARNYIEKKYLGDIPLIKLNPDFWWYAPMPSGESYRIIAEEIINFGKDEDYKTRPYYPIAISAEKVTKDSVFRKNVSYEVFKDRAIVAGIHLGYDPLVVYSNSKTILDSSYLNCSKLKELTQKESLLVLRTSSTSGTFRSYTSTSVCPSLLKEQNNLPLFSDSDTLSKRYFEKEWLALGSLYYGPKDPDLTSAIVLNDKEEIEQKPICIYFLLYKDKESNKYALPDATKEFLTKFQETDTIFNSIFKKIENINDIIENDSIILYYITGSEILCYINDTTTKRYH